MSNAELFNQEQALLASLLPNISNGEVEMMAIGSLLAFPGQAKSALLLKPDDFTVPFWGACFENIIDLMAKDAFSQVASNNAVILSRVIEPLCDDPQAERMKLIRLASAGMLPFDIAEYGKTLRDLSTRRQLVTVAVQSATETIDTKKFPSSSDAISDLADRVASIHSDASRRVARGNAVADTLQNSLSLDVKVFSTGFRMLDEAMGGGLYQSKCYGIAARKKQGKTVIGGQISEALMDQGVIHAYFALEMGAVEIHERLMARRMEKNALVFKDPRSRHNEQFLTSYQLARSTMNEKCIVYVDAPGLTFDDLRRECSFLVASKGVKVIIIDYLQLVGGQLKGESQAQHLDRICQWFAEFARKHEVTFVSLAQINQEGNVRGGEGMRLAFDQVYELQQVEFQASDEIRVEAFLDMMDTRYTKWSSVGTKEVPALRLHTTIGPQFSEIGSQRYSRICELEERRAAARRQRQENYNG